MGHVPAPDGELPDRPIRASSKARIWRMCCARSRTFNLRGLKVAVIGMGNLSSLSSLFERPSRLGVTPLETVDVAQTYIDLLRPLVDLIVFVTHLGLTGDEEMIRHTTGIDVVLGGHNHIVFAAAQGDRRLRSHRWRRQTPHSLAGRRRQERGQALL